MEVSVKFGREFGFEQDDGALREPLPAQAEKQWATHDRSKLAANGGRGAMVVPWKTHKHTSQEVVWQGQERRASGRHDYPTTQVIIMRLASPIPIIKPDMAAV